LVKNALVGWDSSVRRIHNSANDNLFCAVVFRLKECCLTGLRPFDADAGQASIKLKESER